MPNYESGSSAALLVNGRDESRLNNKATLQDGREILDTTTFQTVLNAKTFDYGLASGGASFQGFSQLDNATLKQQMAATLNKNRDAQRILVGPHGLQVGLEALFFEALQSTFATDLGLAGVPSASMQFSTTKYVVRDGVCLHALNGPDSVGGNEVVSLTFTNAPVAQFFALSPDSSAAQTFTFRISDYATDALLIAALKTGIQGLAAYVGRTVTITGSLTGTTAKTGALRIEFDGALNVPNLVVSQGALHELDLVNATAAKTIYGTVVVDPTNSTAASVQTDVRAKGGAYAGVIVTKSGTGGAAVFLFAYPLGAAPTALVQPTLSNNLLLGKTAVDYGGNNNPSVTDGSLSTTMGFGSANPWFIWKFATSVQIARFRFYVVSSNAAGLSIQNGPNGGSLVPVIPIPAGTTNQWIDYTLATPLTFDATHDLVMQATGQNATTFAEIEAYAPGSGSPSPDPQVSVSSVSGGPATTAVPTILQNGGMSTEPVYNVVTASGSDAWVDNSAATQVGFVLRAHLLSLAVSGSLQVFFEHTDADGSGNPNAANIQTLGQFTFTAAGAQGVLDETATVNRFTRTRYVLTGASAVFAAALARE